MLTRVLQLVHGVLTKGIHVTKRDLFYTDVKLFKDQKDSDSVLDDISCMLGCTRNSLHVVASEKGVVVGRLQYRVRLQLSIRTTAALLGGPPRSPLSACGAQLQNPTRVLATVWTYRPHPTGSIAPLRGQRK